MDLDLVQRLEGWDVYSAERAFGQELALSARGWLMREAQAAVISLRA